MNYLEKNGVPLVGNFGQPAEFTSPISYSFTLPWEYSPPLSVRYIANNVGQKKLCVVWVHLSAEIDDIVTRTANEEAARDGAQVVYIEAADVAKPSYDDTVANCQQNAIQKTGSQDGVGMVAILDAFSLKRYWLSFARQTWRPPQVGYAFAMDPQPTGAIPAGYEDVYAVQEMELPSNPTPEVQRYLDGMKKYYPGDMDKLSWATELAWLGAKMFVEALRDAGSSPTRQKVLDALNSMTGFDSGFAPPYTIRPEREHIIARCMKAAKFTSGRKWVQSSDWYCM
ncbi:MAG: ABC transporter substrate-binding protein [Acidobacteria bacterium]|nr:ABC transporter substrate-binding protein [Acidobacteriota bacterium]